MSSKHYTEELKIEALKQVTERGYSVSKVARQDVFDQIEMFYNLKRRHGNSNGLFPVASEKRYFQQTVSVQRIGGAIQKAQQRTSENGCIYTIERADDCFSQQ